MTRHWSALRNIVLTLLVFFVATASMNAQSKYESDFSEFWKLFERHFAYTEEIGIDFGKARLAYQEDAAKVSTDEEFIRLLETAINEFHNGHVTLNTNLVSSNRIIPSGADVWAEYVNGAGVIRDVRGGSRAARSGLKPGMVVKAFNGKPVGEQLARFYPRTYARISPAMLEYAINMLFAGTHDKPRRFTVKTGRSEKEFFPDAITEELPKTPNIEYRILSGNIGLIKINDSLFDFGLIASFDAALAKLSRTRALVLDLTETPSGGNTVVARAIMGRFIARELPYQKHEDPSELRQFGIKRSWTEIVSPRGDTYKMPLIVAVGRWTGSMGEGLAIGFDGIKRAKIVGTRMAGLLGSIEIFRLPATGIGFAIPTERLYHVNGLPREKFLPATVTADSAEAVRRSVLLARAGKS